MKVLSTTLQIVEAQQIEVVKVPLPIREINLNTVYETTILPVTEVTFETSTEPGIRIEVTDVQLVEETQLLTVVSVSTLTQSLVHTRVNIFTSTATNYIRDIDTVSVLKTAYQTVTEIHTAFTQVTLTAQETELSTITITEPVLRTEQVVETVQETVVGGTSTALLVDEFTNTHTLTKMITRTVCLPQESL